MSKLSKAVRLTLIGTAAAGLSACDSADDTLQVRGYENEDQCVESQVFTRAYCKDAYNQALARHQSSAPRFDNKTDCERDFGKDRCEDRTSGGAAAGARSVYSPYMDGYVLGGRKDTSVPSSFAPVYRSSAGKIVTDNGSALPPESFGRNAAPAPASALSLSKPSTPLSTTRGGSFSSSVSSRGGFGGTARGFAAPSVGG